MAGNLRVFQQPANEGINKAKHRFQEPRDATSWLAAIVFSSTDAIVGKTIDGVVTSFNPAAERLFGCRAEEIIGEPVRILIPADRQKEEEHILARIAAGELVEHYDTIRLHKNGSPIHVPISISPVLNGRGGIIGAAKIARDISGHKRAEETLRESETRLRAVLDASPDPIFLKDREGRQVLANPATFAVIGKPAGACLGKTDEQFLDNSAEGRAIMATDRRIMASGQARPSRKSSPPRPGRATISATKPPSATPRATLSA